MPSLHSETLRTLSANAASRASDSVSREWLQDRTPPVAGSDIIFVICNSQCRALGVDQF
jgi:hypothetical protein